MLFKLTDIRPEKVLGFEVDQINSVQFSNHTGYKNGFKGQVLNETQLAEVYSGLVDNELHKLYTHLLTGYVGNPAFLREIANILKSLRAVNPKLIYGTYESLLLDSVRSFCNNVAVPIRER